MRGQDQIIQNRMDGKAPSIVFVNDYPCKTDWFEHGEQATICTHKDALRNLDMRFFGGFARQHQRIVGRTRQKPF